MLDDQLAHVENEQMSAREPLKKRNLIIVYVDRWRKEKAIKQLAVGSHDDTIPKIATL